MKILGIKVISGGVLAPSQPPNDRCKHIDGGTNEPPVRGGGTPCPSGRGGGQIDVGGSCSIFYWRFYLFPIPPKGEAFSCKSLRVGEFIRTVAEVMTSLRSTRAFHRALNL